MLILEATGLVVGAERYELSVCSDTKQNDHTHNGENRFLGHVFKTLYKIKQSVPVIYLGCDGILVSCLPPAVLGLTGNTFQETMHAKRSRL